MKLEIERVLSRNCRGAASKEFAVEMELLRTFRLNIIILIEPRISGEAADKVCRGLGKRRWVRSEARGFSGAIWVLWEEGEVEIKLEAAHRSFLHMEVRSGLGRRWALTTVYASPQASVRQFRRPRCVEGGDSIALDWKF